CPTLSSGTFADEFHVFSIVWDSNFIRWYLDDATTPFHTIDISSSALSEFRAPFFFLMNIAVGGSLGGTPNNAIFPQKMIIDYVRVYQ
ncbi:MAG: family 16 glycosylhydrolase, partial [Gammaproteobacteria bacterium]|nr:family 16 glycosylhydrolase [Gammaproteobacteria bacterium]